MHKGNTRITNLLCLLVATLGISATHTLNSTCWGKTKISSEYIKEHAVKFDVKALDERIINCLTGKRVIVVGERHGSQEIPRVFATLINALAKDKLHPVIVGLEIDKSNQPFIDDFLSSGNESNLYEMPHFRGNRGDGRGSVAIADLLKSSQQMSPPIQVVAFDEASHTKTEEDRDLTMAQNLQAVASSKPNAVLLVLCGNVHSRTAVGAFFDPKYLPMAYQLSHGKTTNERLPVLKPSDVYSITVRYMEGTTWCMPMDGAPGPNNAGTFNNEFSDSLQLDSYFLALPEKSQDGENAILFIRKLSSSPPFQSSDAPASKSP